MMRRQLQGADFPVLGGRATAAVPACPELPTGSGSSSCERARRPHPQQSRRPSALPRVLQLTFKGAGSTARDKTSANENAELARRPAHQRPGAQARRVNGLRPGRPRRELN